MTVLLINPPRSPFNGILQYAPDEARRFIHKKLIGPPLGLLTIAAAVKESGVAVLDMKAEYDRNPDGPDIEQLTLAWLEKHKPRIVGVTVIASEFHDSIRIAQLVKKFDPTIITVAGGLHATLCPESFVDTSIDVVVPGFGVQIIKNIVDCVIQKRDLQTVNGILIKHKGQLRQTAPVQYPNGWNPAQDGFIQPDRSFIKEWIDTYRVGNAPGPVSYLYTSLGCPYQCTFCSIWPQFNGMFYQRDVESIIGELKQLDDYAVVRFADANTVVDQQFIERLFDRIAEEHITKEYVMDIRFDTVVRYPALIEKMAKAGLKIVICGFESFREQELQQYNKSASAQLIEKAVAIFDANGIGVRGNYVVPPDYTHDDFQALGDYASRHKVVYAGYTILTPMPGTVFYNQKKDAIVDHDLRKYNFFNAVLKTVLPLEEFYYSVGKLWIIKRGEDVI